MGRLDGKVALVTGAAGGIGRTAAERFAAEGAEVMLADVLDEEGESAAAAIRQAGGSAAFVHADVTRASDVDAMVAATVERFGRLTVLFNNAGVFLPGDDSVTTTPEDVWDRVIAINLKGVFLGCHAAIPAMLVAGGGSIVNMASFVALMGAATPQIAYTASKGGVLAMTREVAVEFARKGIRANALCPGPVETPLLRSLLGDETNWQRRLVHVPVGRFGRAEEIANGALFLASDESSFMTGAALVIDGGITAAYTTPE
ncbi:MAG TPA: glucose 1-dehydrogenase [Actinomycetota bacterium]|nr:glucose 1-dehydrogenase [Actinomycetota bacterium]